MSNLNEDIFTIALLASTQYSEQSFYIVNLKIHHYWTN